LSTERVFFGGHSLGGIVLESYISGHAELAQVNFINRAYVIQSILTYIILAQVPSVARWILKPLKKNLILKKIKFLHHMLFCNPWVPEYIGQFGPAVCPA